MSETPKTSRATRREWIGLAVIALACVLYVMDLTVLHLAIPAISEDLQPTSAQLLWIIDIYGFMVAGSLITMGTLGDRIGRRRLLMIGAAAFGVTSVLAAFSSSPEMLIATRALLGIAGATIAPSTLSLIRNMFLDPQQRQTAIAVWITSFSVGAAIGPLLGGLVLEFFWWGAAFLLAVPVMALPAEKAEIQTPIATARWRWSWNIAKISDSVEGARVAPAIPSSARLTISMSGLVENAASSETAPNAAAPMSRSRRRPIRSPSVPIVIRNPATMNP